MLYLMQQYGMHCILFHMEDAGQLHSTDGQILHTLINAKDFCELNILRFAAKNMSACPAA